jgi:hypothetical protein
MLWSLWLESNIVNGTNSAEGCDLQSNVKIRVRISQIYHSDT